MRRAILYYPTISINNPRWIRQMIFYWDEIGSIVPSDLTDDINDSQEIRQLWDAGIFQPYNPESYVQRGDQLSEEFIHIQQLISYQDIAKNQWSRRPHPFQIYSEKIPTKLQEYFIENQIAKVVNGNWFSMDRRIGLLYMSLLAKYLADQENNPERVVIPGTDYGLYADLVLKNKDETQDYLPGMSFTLNNILPVPRDDVPLEKILKFKEDRRDELLNFRQVIYKFQDTLKNEVSESADLKDYLARFSEEITIGVNEIDKLSQSDKLSITLGAVRNIMAIKSPALIVELLNKGEIPLEIKIGGAIVGGLSIAKYFLDVRNAQQKKLADSSFSYIYLAQHKDIIKTQ